MLLSLVLVNVYVFFFKDGLTFHDVVKKAQIEMLKKRTPEAPAETRAEPKVVEGDIRIGETVQQGLVRIGLPAKNAQRMAKALSESGIRRATPGDHLTLSLDPDNPGLPNVVAVEYQVAGAAVVRLERDMKKDRWIHAVGE